MTNDVSFRVRAPGRINLIGEHVDYQDGWVMPLAIDRYIEADITPLAEPIVRLESEFAPGEIIECALDHLAAHEGDRSWVNYVIGVIAEYAVEGMASPGFAMNIRSTLPSGAGLSSSAALETATALTVERLAGVERDPVQRALICQRAEHVWAGVPCGIMDQLAVGASQAGHALMIDCRDHSLQAIPLPEGVSIVVADTGVKHALAEGEYQKRREDCEAAAAHFNVHSLRDVTPGQVEAAKGALGDRLYRRARHVVSEIARVPAFADALVEKKFELAGTLMRASHNSLRDDFEVSCPELDALVDAAYAFGAERGLIGARMTGGGFGGSTVNLVRDEAVPAFKAQLEQVAGADRVFVTRAAAAAAIISAG